jgi:NAD kinase
MKVGIMVNERKPDARATVRALVDVLVSRKIEVLLHEQAARLIEAKTFYHPHELARQADIIAVLGGDGTMLSSMEKLGKS